MRSMTTPSTNRRGAPHASLRMNELEANARDASMLLKALAHDARLIILCQLADGERSVSELTRALKLRQPAISQQLARLREDDLVETRRNGKNIYYSIARPEVREIIAALYRTFCRR